MSLLGVIVQITREIMHLQAHILGFRIARRALGNCTFNIDICLFRDIESAVAAKHGVASAPAGEGVQGQGS